MRSLANPTPIMQRIGKDENDDLLEAPFAALIQASKKDVAHWRDQARTRVIIHVADHGNRERNQTSEQTMAKNDVRRSDDVGLVETIGIDQVVGALRDSGISYWPVAVFGGDPARVVQAPERHRRARELFQQQAEQIAHATLRGNTDAGRSLKFLTLTFDPNVETESLTERVVGIQKALRVAFQQAVVPARTVRAETYCAENPNSQECQQSLDMIKGLEPIVTQVFAIEREAREVSPETTLDIARREQVVARAWLPPRNTRNQRQLTYWMALDPYTLNQLKGAMSDLCNGFEFHAQRADSIERTLGRNINPGQTGRLFNTLQSGLEARFSIPANYASEYFALDLEILKQDAMSDSEIVRGLWQAICRSSFMLSQVQVRGTRFDPKQAQCTKPALGCNSNNGACVTCTPPQQRIENYLWEVPDVGAPIFYVPVEYLP